jgi:hypothetical protein
MTPLYHVVASDGRFLHRPYPAAPWRWIEVKSRYDQPLRFELARAQELAREQGGQVAMAPRYSVEVNKYSHEGSGFSDVYSYHATETAAVEAAIDARPRHRWATVHDTYEGNRQVFAAPYEHPGETGLGVGLHAM